MKNEFRPQSAGKHFSIPDEIMENSTLKQAETIDAYSNPCSMQLLNRKLTAKQIIQTVDMLNTVATGLVVRMERAAMLHEERYRRVAIPEELLREAGIHQGVLLDICAGDGEIYITIAEEEPEGIPSFLRELFENCELDFGALRCLLESEEPICE